MRRHRLEYAVSDILEHFERRESWPLRLDTYAVSYKGQIQIAVEILKRRPNCFLYLSLYFGRECYFLSPYSLKKTLNCYK